MHPNIEFISLKLEARNYNRNTHRYYNIMTSKNLMGEYEIITCYGRIGKSGKVKIHYCDSYDELQKKLRSLVNKRTGKSAHSRLGCTYSIID